MASDLGGRLGPLAARRAAQGVPVGDVKSDAPELAGTVMQAPPSEGVPGMIAQEGAHAAATSMSQLVQSTTQNRTAGMSRNGLLLDDLVRDELRPLIKEWLDHHLPPLVERLLRAELERLIADELN